jgi:hypothetical protein
MYKIPYFSINLNGIIPSFDAEAPIQLKNVSLNNLTINELD